MLAFTAVSAIPGTPGLSLWGLCEPGNKVLGARWQEQELTLGNNQRIMEYPKLNPQGSSSPSPTAQLLQLLHNF